MIKGEKTISILDYAGAKAGMDYYSMSLAKAITKNDLVVSIYSNFVDTTNQGVFVKPVFNINVSKTIPKIMDALWGTLKASVGSRKNKADFVIMHLFSASLISFVQFLIMWIFGNRLVTIIHDVEGFKVEHLWYRKVIIQLFSWRLVVHNEYSRTQTIKSGFVKNENKLFVIKHGGFIEKLDIQKKVDLSAALKHFNLDENTQYALFFGQISEAKGLHVLLNAIPHLKKELKIIVAGRVIRGYSFDNYQKIIDTLNLQDRVIKILRFITDEEMHFLFSIAKIIVVPYVRSYQSGVLLMAMSNGIPVLASDIPPMKEIIRNGENGILFKSEDPYNLATQLNSYFTNVDENYRKYRENALNTVTHDYSWEVIGKQYVDLFFK